MYQFSITKDEQEGFRFELDGIKMLIEGYVIVNNMHRFVNPEKAVAFFDIENNLYGISNRSTRYATAEEFYDAMVGQYKVFA